MNIMIWGYKAQTEMLFSRILCPFHECDFASPKRQIRSKHMCRLPSLIQVTDGERAHGQTIAISFQGGTYDAVQPASVRAFVRLGAEATEGASSDWQTLGSFDLSLTDVYAFVIVCSKAITLIAFVGMSFSQQQTKPTSNACESEALPPRSKFIVNKCWSVAS